MAKDMHEVLNKYVLSTFKKYPTTVQDTLLRIIGDKLQRTYDLTDNFTEDMLTPDNSRPDIIKVKAKQYDFDIRNEASLSEQNKLLDAINIIRSKRGSIDSIENMWLYYGGNLPKNVTVEIPAQGLFKYSISNFSGKDRFQDEGYYRPGVYNINIDGDYDLNSLRDFVNKELVAAGTKVNYIKSIPSFINKNSESSMATSNLYKRYILYMQSYISLNKSGLMWSSFSRYNTWSGRSNLFVDIARIWYLDPVKLDIIPYDLSLVPTKSAIVIVVSDYVSKGTVLSSYLETICTPLEEQGTADIHFYDIEGNEIKTDTKYPEYFVLSETLLGEVINR